MIESRMRPVGVGLPIDRLCVGWRRRRKNCRRQRTRKMRWH